jgi:hypothetical protein
VNKRFRFCSHDQPFLLPPSLQYWLPENHLARFVADVMNELDLSSIYARYERSDGRGLSGSCWGQTKRNRKKGRSAAACDLCRGSFRPPPVSPSANWLMSGC